MKEQQFAFHLETIPSPDCSDSEQPLSGGASAGTDHSDLTGAPSTAHEHLCKTSGHCVSFCWANAFDKKSEGGSCNRSRRDT